MIEELRVRNLSDITLRLYVGAAERFAKYYGRSPDQLGPEQIREFFIHLLDQKSSANTVQLYRSALKFLYVKTLRRKWFEGEVATIRQRLKLPTVLSADEITRMLDRTTNLKHWTVIATLYATGLCVSELVRLKVDDIDSQRMLIHVREGKGRIPRDIGLSPSLLERLRVYWRKEKPKEWSGPQF
jgi:site-specific recombinase XerD